MIKFHKTKTFLSKNGKISDSDYERLKFDIEKRNASDILPEGGGLRTVRAGKGGCDGLADDGWLVVYAFYADYDLVIFLVKFKENVKKKFNSREARILCGKKQELDKQVKKYFKKYR